MLRTVHTMQAALIQWAVDYQDGKGPQMVAGHGDDAKWSATQLAQCWNRHPDAEAKPAVVVHRVVSPWQ